MEVIQARQQELAHHPVFNTLRSVKDLQHFMRYHAYAVWDFMSLLKSLQRHITCVEIPWRPSAYPAEVVRFINQIVVGEECDLDQAGKATSHFDLYLRAMEEVGASTSEISDFLNHFDLEMIPAGAREFVSYNLEVARQGHVVEVAASFFFGREKLIPEMFQTIVDILRKENIEAPTFLYYLERHIEVDGEEHGPLALKCLDVLTGNDPLLKEQATAAGLKALEMRQLLWDTVLNTSHKT
jgi:hypothetical protein